MQEDRGLEPIGHFLPILKRGIAVHHSGLLPLLKELVELLFQEGLIKARAGGASCTELTSSRWTGLATELIPGMIWWAKCHMTSVLYMPGCSLIYLNLQASAPKGLAPVLPLQPA